MNNKLTNFAKELSSFYSVGTSNHLEHNDNVDYFNILLSPITSDSIYYKNKTAMDFGCGKGRNVVNLFDLAEWKKVDGVDISGGNIEYCKNTYKNLPSEFFQNNGLDLKSIADETYDFVMSTIVFQHIPVWSIRYGLKQEIFRCLKHKGVFSFQMGFGNDLSSKHNHKAYPEDLETFSGSNGMCDVQITPETKDLLLNDLAKIGFSDIKYQIRPSYIDDSHSNWIYITGVKS